MMGDDDPPRPARQARATVTFLAPQAPLGATPGGLHVDGLRPPPSAPGVSLV